MDGIQSLNKDIYFETIICIINNVIGDFDYALEQTDIDNGKYHF